MPVNAEKLVWDRVERGFHCFYQTVGELLIRIFQHSVVVALKAVLVCVIEQIDIHVKIVAVGVFDSDQKLIGHEIRVEYIGFAQWLIIGQKNGVSH